jgi:putative redox protein
MTSTINYLGDLECELTHTKSGTKIKTDAPTDNNGKGSAFSPSDLVATATGACMMTVMGIVAKRNNWDLIGSTVEVDKIMTPEPPRRIAALNIRVQFCKNNFDDKDIKKNVEFLW